MNLQEKYNEYKQRQEAKKFFNQNNDYHLSISDYIKNIVSDTSFEMIYELNKKENIEEVNIDQMSIFEFIGDTNESRI